MFFVTVLQVRFLVHLHLLDNRTVRLFINQTRDCNSQASIQMVGNYCEKKKNKKGSFQGGAVNRDFTDLTERFESMVYFSLKIISMEMTVETSEHYVQCVFRSVTKIHLSLSCVLYRRAITIRM